MDLYIDTADKLKTCLELKKTGEVLASHTIQNNFDQAEKLLTGIDRLLLDNDLTKADLTKIYVNSQGDSFTALRIGVITANALAYALGIPVFNFDGQNISKDNLNFVVPEYSQEPSIT